MAGLIWLGFALSIIVWLSYSVYLESESILAGVGAFVGIVAVGAAIGLLLAGSPDCTLSVAFADMGPPDPECFSDYD